MGPVPWELCGEKCGTLRILLGLFFKRKKVCWRGWLWQPSYWDVARLRRAQARPGCRCGFPVGAMPRSRPCTPVPCVRSIARNPLELGVLRCRSSRCIGVGSEDRARSGQWFVQRCSATAAAPRGQHGPGPGPLRKVLLCAGLCRARREQKVQKHLPCLALATTPLN